MSDQAKKVKLKNTAGVELLPRTSIDNIVIAVGSTVSALVTSISGTTASDQKFPTEKAVADALAGKLSSVPDATSSTKGIVKVTTTASNGVALAISSGAISVSTTQASTSTYGTVKIGTNISVSNGTISVADASSSTKGVVKLCTDIASTTSANPGGAADAYAVKLYVADQLDSISGTYILAAGLVSDLSGVTGTGSGGGDNPPTAWAVKQALDGKQATLSQGTNVTISNSTVSVANASDSAKGVVELATVAEAKAGTDTSRAVTPAGLASFLLFEEITA